MSTSPSSKRVLFVDDDPIVLRIYQEGLARRGFEVTTATDGLGALKALKARTPDILVLDLMMPKFSGAEVLQYIRGQKETASLPVIVLSNAYMDTLAHDAAKLAQKGLLKINANPGTLAEAITGLLEGNIVPNDPDHLLAAPEKLELPKQNVAEPATNVSEQSSSAPPESDSKEQARRELAAHTSAVARSLREGCEGLLKAANERERKMRLESLYRKVHFVTSMAGLAEQQSLSQMASAFEALLFSMMDKGAELEPSMQRTLTASVAFLQELLQRPTDALLEPQRSPNVLVVDDDRISNHLVVSALHNAQLQARGTKSPEQALQWLQENVYDLVLLDIEMPGMDGLELCKRLRTLPGYTKTPVIYVTLHSDFQTRAKTELSGGNDLIAKPIVPAELAVKVVMHLLRRVVQQG